MKYPPAKAESTSRAHMLAMAAMVGMVSVLSGPVSAEPAKPFNAEVLAQNPTAKGVVLISANWGRRWGCGRYDNAQLQLLGFDKVEGGDRPASQRPDLLIQGAESGNAAQIPFSNYAFLVDPGEYEFSRYLIHVARSMSRTGDFMGDRKTLFENGRSKVGSFKVNAGEIVYVGHFAVDCLQAPMPWRFYPETRTDFEQYLGTVKQQYPDMDTSNVVFRLFDTKIIGTAYTLP